MGRPVAFSRRMDDVTSPTPSEIVEVAYTPSGRIARIESLPTGEIWVPEDGWPIGMANVPDPRADILAREPRTKAHPDYGVVEFSETTFDAIPFNPLQQGIPNFEQAMSVRSLGSVLLSPSHIDAIIWFERASNPVFQPTEYHSTNCCVPCFACPYCWNELTDAIIDLCGCLDISGGGGDEDDDEPKCRPCDPPVGTKMHKYNARRYRVPFSEGSNHGVPGYFHYHHFEVHQEPTNGNTPCRCFNSGGYATDSKEPGEIPYRYPTGGGLE